MFLSGIFPALTTPFYPDGKVYYKKLEHNVDRYSRTPAAGMAVLGSTGEAVMLSEEEQREVLRIAIEVTAPEKVLVAGVGHESALQTLSFAEYAATLGYDVVLVRTPHYYRGQMKPENQLAFYRFVADRSPLPVLLYSVPPFTAYDLPLEVAAELGEHPNILGIKESSGSIEKIQVLAEKTCHIKHTVNVTEIFNAVTGRMLAPQTHQQPTEAMVPIAALAGASAGTGASTSVLVTEAAAKPKFKMRTKEVSYQILAGAAQKLEPSLEAGAVGAVVAFGAAAPTACFEVYAAWREGDHALAKEKQERISAAAKRMGELGIPALKYAMDLNGYYGGPARLPFLPLTADLRSEVEKLMADIRN
jgi:4-hydroxy-2-oxoglutarate aldolase